MEYFFWSSMVVWGSLIVYVLYLRSKTESLKKKLMSGENSSEN